MTTEMIETLANRGELATGDFNLKATLRYEAIPEFWSRLPESVWRRRIISLPVAVLYRGPVELPDDFYSMISVHIVPGIEVNNTPCALGSGLPYIGEEPHKVAAAEVSAVEASIGGYYVGARTDGQLKGVFWDNIPDNSPRVGIFTYVSYPFFANAGESLEMGRWIPDLFQQGLIHLLRSKIYADRYGEGDQRTQEAYAKYEQTLERAVNKYALARRNHVVYVT